jgi:hypothetical protein
MLVVFVDRDDGRVQAQYDILKDDGTSEYVAGAEYPSREMAVAVFSDCGWSNAGNSSNPQRAMQAPELRNAPLLGVPVAAHSLNPVPSQLELTEEERKTGVWPQIHSTMHPYMGRCFGFSYVAGYPTDPERGVDVEWAAVLRPFDPVLDLVSGALVKIECVGHWLTQTSALQAARDFYYRARRVVGERTFDTTVALFVRKEDHERRAAAAE